VNLRQGELAWPSANNVSARLAVSGIQVDGKAVQFPQDLLFRVAPELRTTRRVSVRPQQAIKIVLPAASGGSAPITYVLSPLERLPQGLAFNPEDIPSPTITGSITANFGQPV
jgi:hypothetical protein